MAAAVPLNRLIKAIEQVSPELKAMEREAMAAMAAMVVLALDLEQEDFQAATPAM